MPSSRNEYLKSLNRMRANYQNQGNVLVNTQDDSTNVGQEMSSFAYMNTPVPAPVEEPKKENKDFWSQFFGTIDETAAKFGAGFVGAWEGGLDLLATGIGSLGDATGWYKGDVFTDWAKQDIGTALAEWTKTYANLNPWAIAQNAASGNFANEEYWKDMGKGALDILGTAFFADNKLDKNYREDANKYYGFDDEYDTVAGEFLGQAAHTIGFMLPSIMTGGAGASVGVSKAISLGVMGVGAGGKASEEALNENAKSYQALAYGILSGSIEAGTEMLPLPFGSGSVGGFGGKTVKEIFGKMLEEGTEEAISEVLNPLIKGITYKPEALKDYTSGEHYLNVLSAFGSGAIMGGVFSGVHIVDAQKKLGKDGITVVNNLEAVREEIKQAQKKYKKGKITENDYTKLLGDLQTKISDIKTQFDNLSPEKQKNMREMFKNPELFKEKILEEKDAETLKQDEEVKKILETKLEKDGVANRYEFVQDFNDIKGWTLKPSEKEGGVFAYSNNPLREATLKEQLPFEDVAKKFNIPTSLEKTYSKKLEAKNPVSVLKFIAKYANTDVNGVLNTLGFDAFEYKNGDIVIEKAENLLKGDLKYGQQKGSYGYSSLVERYGRKSSFEQLQRYVEENGRKLKTEQERQEYEQIVRSNHAYTEKTVYNEQVDIIEKNAYTKNMRDIEKANNKLGAKTEFILAKKHGSFKLVSGFYDNKGTIYHVVDTADTRTFEERNAHEVFHYLEDEYNLSSISDVFDILEEWKTQYPNEYADVLNEYAQAYEGKYDIDEDFENKLDSEIAADIYSKHLKIEDKGIADRIIKTVDKVRKLGKEGALEKLNDSIENEDFKPVSLKYTVLDPVDKKRYEQRILDSDKYNIAVDCSWNTKYVAEEIDKIKQDKQTSLKVRNMNKDNSSYGGAFIVFRNLVFGKILQKVFPDNLPVIMSRTHAYKNLNPHPVESEQNWADSWHDMKPLDFAKAVNALSKDPLLMSINNNGIAFLTDLKDKKGNNLFVALEKFKHQETGVESYRIKSIYAKESFYQDSIKNKDRETLEGTVKKGKETRILFDKEKSSSGGHSHHTPEDISNIVKEFENVKPKYTLTKETIAKNGTDDYDADVAYRNKQVPKRASIGLAITYDESIDSASYDQKIAKYKPMVEKRAGAIAKLLGLNITVGEAVGGWTFTDNANKVVIGGEPSFPIDVNGFKSLDDLKLFASLLADTTYEVQNSVGVFEYNESGNDIEDTFYLTKVDDGLNEIIKNVKLEGFTLKKADKKLVIVGAEDVIIDTLLTELENGGYLDGKHQATKCNANWLGLKERADLYQTWLKNGVGEENGSLRGYVTKANKINKYITSHLDKNGYRTEGTENNASNILKLLSQEKVENRPTEREITKAYADAYHEKVYDLKTTNQIVENALTNMVKKFDNAVKISIPDGKGKVKNFTFEELNAYKNKQKAIENIVDQIENAVITFDNGTNGQDKVAVKELDLREDLTKAITGLIAHKGSLSEKSKWVAKYYKTLARYSNYVHRRAELTNQYMTAVKAQKTLEAKFENTKEARLGGENIVQELSIYKKMVSGFELSKTKKNVAPRSFTSLVDNFSKMNPENYGDFYDTTIADLVETLRESFVDGKFPDREPTLEEMVVFNAIRARVLKRMNEFASEKYAQKQETAKEGALLASVLKGGNSYGKLKSTLDSDLSLPVYLRKYLGYDHPLVKHFFDNWQEATSKQTLKEEEFKNFVYEKLAEEAGFKAKGELLRELKKKITTNVVDRNGNAHKITVNDAIGAYWTYRTAEEQLLATGLTQVATDTKTKTNIDFKLLDNEYQQMFDAIPEKARQWADLVFDKYFNGKDFDYKNKVIEDFFGLRDLLTTNKGTYAPTSRVGQTNKGLAPESGFNSGALSTMLKGFLKERVKNKNHFRWVKASDLVDNNISSVTRWGEMSHWVEDLRIMLNTPIAEAGNHTLEYYLENNLPEWKATWSDYMTKIVLGKPIIEKKNGVFEFIGNIGQVSTLGFNFLGSVPKQVLSDFSWVLDEKVSWTAWVKTIPQAISNFFRMGKIKKELMEANGYFIERFNEKDVIKAILNGNMPNKIAQVVLKPMEWLDSVVVRTHGYALARHIVDNGNYGFKRNSPEYKREVAKTLQGLVLLTQSNSDPMFMSRLRSGHINWLTREVFGRFHSDAQNKYQALQEITFAKQQSDARVKMLEQASTLEKYSEEVREMFKKAAKRERVHFRKKYGEKVLAFIVSMLLNGLGLVAITSFKNKFVGKEEWNKFEVEELAKSVFFESTINWLPYVGTIANAIQNNSDVSAFTLEKLNNVVDLFNQVKKAFETGKETDIRKAIVNLIKNGLELTGVPANNIYQLFMGIWYQIDKEGSLTAQNWVKGYTAQYMKSQYSTYIKEGRENTAIAQLGAWSSMYGTNIIDKATLEEIVRLDLKGYSVSPSPNMTSYTSEIGEEVRLTTAQANAFKTAYSKSNKVVAELLRTTEYKNADDKAKASAISKTFKAYHDYARAKALGVPPSSKLAKLLYYTNGNVELAKYISGLQKLSKVSGDKTRSRKENAIAMINGLKGFSREEKLLLAYLSGYSVSEKNRTLFENYLIRLGFSKNETKEFTNIS